MFVFLWFPIFLILIISYFSLQNFLQFGNYISSFFFFLARIFKSGMYTIAICCMHQWLNWKWLAGNFHSCIPSYYSHKISRINTWLISCLPAFKLILCLLSYANIDQYVFLTCCYLVLLWTNTFIKCLYNY